MNVELKRDTCIKNIIFVYATHRGKKPLDDLITNLVTELLHYAHETDLDPLVIHTISFNRFEAELEEKLS